MGIPPKSLNAWVASAGDDAGVTLSAHYLGEELTCLNLDQIVQVVNELWNDFCRSQSKPGQAFTKDALAERFGEWMFIRGGMSNAEMAMDGNHRRVDRFCGGWTLAGDDTAAMLESLYDAAPENRRP